MQKRTQEFVAALRFVGRLGRAARTAKEWTVVGRVWDEIRLTNRAGGDVGAVLARFGVAVRYQKYTGPDIPAQRSTNQPPPYHVDDLVRAIIGTDGNGYH